MIRIFLLLLAIGTTSALLAAVGAWRSPREPSPGLLGATVVPVLLAGDLFRALGTIATFQSAPNVSPDARVGFVTDGLEAASQPLWVAAGLAALVCFVHLWGVRRAGRDVLTVSATSRNAVALVVLSSSVFLRHRFWTLLNAGSLDAAAAVAIARTLHTSIALDALGMLAFGALAVRSLITGLVEEQRRVREM